MCLLILFVSIICRCFGLKILCLIYLVCELFDFRRKKDAIVRKVFAKIIITQFARCILARNRVKAKADELYRRIWDVESSTYYYANVHNGETSWIKSKVYLNPSSEPPIYDVAAASNVTDSDIAMNIGASVKINGSKRGIVKVGTSSKRLSPRANRVL